MDETKKLGVPIKVSPSVSIISPFATCFRNLIPGWSQKSNAPHLDNQYIPKITPQYTIYPSQIIFHASKQCVPISDYKGVAVKITQISPSNDQNFPVCAKKAPKDVITPKGKVILVHLELLHRDKNLTIQLSNPCFLEQIQSEWYRYARLLSCPMLVIDGDNRIHYASLTIDNLHTKEAIERRRPRATTARRPRFLKRRKTAITFSTSNAAQSITL